MLYPSELRAQPRDISGNAASAQAHSSAGVFERLLEMLQFSSHPAVLAKALAQAGFMRCGAAADLYRFPAILSCLMAKDWTFKSEFAAEQIAREKAFNLLYFTES
jgi:hypothetical protein